MPQVTFAELINSAQVMSAGMQNNATEASKRGWLPENTDKLIAARAAAIALNDQQEKLKAELKTKTAELDAKMAELKAIMKEAKKVVKLGCPQSGWLEFGVTDKR
jgi:hypothetical protein